jgi:hypothetical protein
MIKFVRLQVSSQRLYLLAPYPKLSRFTPTYSNRFRFRNPTHAALSRCIYSDIYQSQVINETETESDIMMHWCYTMEYDPVRVIHQYSVLMDSQDY